MKKIKPMIFMFAVLLICFCVLPFLYILIRSVLNVNGDFTLEYFYHVFLAQSQYLLRFWKSLALSACIAAGQMLISILAGYSFAKSKFPGRNFVFFLLILIISMMNVIIGMILIIIIV